MKIYKAKDYADMSRKAANILSAQVIMKPDCVLGLATGSTPIGVYNQLVEWYNKGDIDFAQVRTVNLDEYCGLSPDNVHSYAYFMRKYLFDRVNISLSNTNIPDGLAENGELECIRYDKVIQKLGGVDMQLLGLGHDGHIGFNEPEEAFEKSTHVAVLKPETRQANQRFFGEGEEVPTQAITMGIKSIMQARKILLIVSGEDKAAILARALEGPVTPRIPASILQLHNDVTVVADTAALSFIKS